MRKRKTLEELNLLDDFLFGSMVADPEFGEEFSRELLKIILGRDFGRLKVTPQKMYYGDDTRYHGTRLDVCLEEEIQDMEVGSIYDIEPEQKSGNRISLPQRIRFYHAKIDAQSLEFGLDYRKLKRVVVIMIMPFDPFGYDHMVYTIRNGCVELPHMEYDDGAKTLFLYTKGKKGNPPEGLRQLLRYMEKTTEQNAVSEQLQKIHRMVHRLKRKKEVSLEYMKIFEREQMLLEEGREAGLLEGHKSGMAEANIAAAQRMLKEGLSSELISRYLQMSVEEIEKIRYASDELS